MARILERWQARNTSNSCSKSKSQRPGFRSSARLTSVTGSSRSSFTSPITEKLRMSDQDLLARARSAVAKLDFAALADTSPAKWTWHRDLNELSLFEGVGTCVLETPDRQHCLGFRRRKTCNASELLVAGDINCSIEEVAAVLRSETEGRFNTTMRDLHRRAFIYGSVVHTTPLPWHTDCDKPANATPATSLSTELASSLAESSGAAASDSSRNNYVALKAATFVHSTLLSRNEEWRFLESFECSPSGDSLVVNRSSLPALFGLGSGIVPAHARVVQLRGISTAFLVERIPRTKSVRLVFHAKCADDSNESENAFDDGGSDSEELSVTRSADGRSAARSKTVATRLRKIAKDVGRIPEIIRRRRIGAQTLASKSALAAASNSRCPCCTKSLRLLSLLGKKQRCHLCAYNVCGQCSSQQLMETRNGHVTNILMCRRCVECVDACDFAGLSAEPSHYDACVELDVSSASSRALAKKRSAAIRGILENALDARNEIGGGDANMAAAATTVIQHIVRQTCDQVRSDERLSISDLLSASASSFATTSTSSSAAQPSARASPAAPPLKCALIAKLMDEVEGKRSQPLRIEDCVLASAETRSYPIHVPANPRVCVPDYPVPANEAWRLRVIDANSFLALGEVPELNVICALAAETLQCAISMVTVIDQETEHILSCNNPELHRTRMARNQTFCSHLIMDSRPLLIRHPEADVRFHAMDAVTKSGVRFYCGFPLRARDGTVVGSVCCLDFQQRALTQSQYSLMEKLAKTASSVVQAKGAAISSSRKSC